MAVLPVLLYPDPRLTVPSESIGDFGEDVRRLGGDLVDTLRSFPGAVGISAPQVGDLRRLIVVDVSPRARKQSHHGLLVLANPRIIRREGEITFREGCLSLPEYTGNVRRAERIALEASDTDGNRVELASEGIEAVCLQHEIDHLDGILFIHRVSNLKTDIFRRKRFPPM